VIRDRLGSVRGLTDATGAVTDTYHYDAYGTPLPGTGTSTQPFGWGGHLWDEDFSLYYSQARWYDPEAGRFLSRDPVPGKTEKPLTRHPYAFGRADPVHWIDPTGDFTLTMTMAVTGIILGHSAISATFGLGLLQRVSYMIYGQAGHYPLRWSGPQASASISAGFVGGAAYDYHGTATNEQGSTTANVLFGMVGATFGTKGGVSVSWNQEYDTWNWGQSARHPDWPVPGRPNPYPLEGMVIMSGIGSARLKYIITCAGPSQTSVFGGIALTAASWSDPGCSVTGSGGKGLKENGKAPPIGWSAFDLFVGASKVLSDGS
jgi:RHS repeat-associated protein